MALWSETHRFAGNKAPTALRSPGKTLPFGDVPSPLVPFSAVTFPFPAEKIPSMPAKKKSRAGTAKRELITPHKGDSRYAKRTAGGQFKEMDDVGRSQKADKARTAKKTAKPGLGDQGDQKKKSSSKKKS